MSLIQEKALHHQAQVTPFSVPVKALTNTQIPIQGICKMTLYRDTCRDAKPIGDHHFLVTSQDMKQFEGILGNDWFTKNKAVMDYKNHSISIDQFSIPFHFRLSTPELSTLTLSVTDSIHNTNIVNVKEAAGPLNPAKHSQGFGVEPNDGGQKTLQGSPTSNTCIGDEEVTEGRVGVLVKVSGQAEGPGVEPGEGKVTSQGLGVAPSEGRCVSPSAQGPDGESGDGTDRTPSAQGSGDAPDEGTEGRMVENTSKFGSVYDQFNTDFYLFSGQDDSLPPNSAGYIAVNAPTKVLTSNNATVLAESCLVNQPFLVGAALLDLNNPVLAVPYVNMTTKSIQLKAGTILARATYINDLDIFDGREENEEQYQLRVNAVQTVTPTRTKSKTAKESDSDCSEIPKSTGNTGIVELPMPSKKSHDNLSQEKKVEKLIEDGIKRCECPDQLIPKLRTLLWKFKTLLADKDDKPGYCNLYQPSINLDTDVPIYQAQYPIPFQMRKVINETVAKFLKDGIVQHSNSPYNAPTIIVAKKDIGTRMCVDFRRLNSHLITDRHPLPRISQILEQLGGAVYLTALDLLHGFYNLEINPADRYKTAFSTPDGHYEFIRLPMGLKNSPSIFQRVMNLVLTDVLGRYAFIYIDDIVIYSKSAEEHLQHLEIIFSRLQKYGLKIKFSKCQLMQTQIEYLGFLVGKDGLHVNPKKVEAIQKFPRPTDVRGIQAFLGVVGYFRTFVLNFAAKARGLYMLLRKETPFLWGKEQEDSFTQLKEAMMRAPVLALPDFDKPFILTTDASGYAIAAILTQESKDGKKEHLISCHSRMLKGAEANYHTLDREILAVFYGVEQNRSYLWGNKFTIRTDNLAIPYLERNKTSDSRRAIQWFLKLSEYDYTVEHRKGKTIPHADAFSRYPASDDVKQTSKRTATVAYVSPQFTNEDYLPSLPDYVWVEHTAKVPKDKVPTGDKVREEKGLYKIQTESGTVTWVPPTLRDQLIRLYHEPPCSGHKGRRKTLKAMNSDFYWTNMHKDVNKYIAKCDYCQKYKNYGNRSAPYKVTTIPATCFEEVSLDVVGPLPTSADGNRYSLCVQDRLSRWVLFTPMTNAGAEMTTRIFLKEWVVVFGPPRRLLTDRGTNFTSVYFEELAKFLGTKPTQTVAYRPQANGQNERTHRDLHQYLSLYVDQTKREHWDLLLKMASWAHNIAYHEALGASPYEVVFGIKPNLSKMWLPSQMHTIDENKLQEYFGLRKEKLERIRDAARHAISRSQQNFLIRQSKKQTPREYFERQLVLVKQHRASKWAPKWDGPFEVKRVISESVLLVKHLGDEREDTVHVDYVRPYYSRDGSPAVGSNAEFPAENDDRGKDIIYDTGILYDKPEADNTVEVETRVVPDQTRANKVADPSNFNDNRRITRSQTRMLQERTTAESSTLQQSTRSTKATSAKATSAKPQSLLSHARASVQRIIPKKVSFSTSTKQQPQSTPRESSDISLQDPSPSASSSAQSIPTSNSV